VYVQTNLQEVTSAIRNAVGLIIILLGLGLWLVSGFTVRVRWWMENNLRLAHFSVPRDGKKRFKHIDFRPHGRKIASAWSFFLSVVDGK